MSSASFFSKYSDAAASVPSEPTFRVGLATIIGASDLHLVGGQAYEKFTEFKDTFRTKRDQTMGPAALIASFPEAVEAFMITNPSIYDVSDPPVKPPINVENINAAADKRVIPCRDNNKLLKNIQSVRKHAIGGESSCAGASEPMANQLISGLLQFALLGKRPRQDDDDDIAGLRFLLPKTKRASTAEDHPSSTAPHVGTLVAPTVDTTLSKLTDGASETLSIAAATPHVIPAGQESRDALAEKIYAFWAKKKHNTKTAHVEAQPAALAEATLGELVGVGALAHGCVWARRWVGEQNMREREHGRGWVPVTLVTSQV